MSYTFISFNFFTNYKTNSLHLLIKEWVTQSTRTL